LNILIVIPAYYPALEFGGPIPVARELARRFSERGHEITIWTTNLLGDNKKLGNATEERTVDGIRTVYFNSVLRYRWVGITPDVYRYLRKDGAKYDIIHVYGYREFLTVAVTRWAASMGIPYVLQSMGTVARISRSLGKKLLYDSFLGRGVLQNSSVLLAKSYIERDQYLQAGIGPEKISVIPNGMDVPPEASSTSPGEFRREYGLPVEAPLILFLGRLHPVKGVELLVRAFIRLGGQTRLAIVGPDEGQRDRLERLVAEGGVGDKVVFTGPLYEDQKWAAYSDADIYVLPSMFEIFPRSVLEAMCCGTPVILTDRCGIAPQIEERAGLVVPYEEEALAQAMKCLADDVDLRERFSERGRRLLKEEFSWEPIVEKLEALYGEVISSTRKSG
jgi:glycosyltransferase involved in cell wall biosynthesis